MNIFVLDRNPVLAAQQLCDKHVVKMVLESTQMLSTVARKQRPEMSEVRLYKPTHAKHPCTVWAGESAANTRWLIEHTEAMFEEYNTRFGRDKPEPEPHKSYEVFENAKWLLSLRGPIIDPSRWALAMPDQYKDRSGDPVKSYRAYYVGEKAGFASWRRSTHGIPDWWPNDNA
jgi:hypothetical protein